MASSAPRTAFDVRLSARDMLSPIERRVLEICEQAADDGRELDSIESMAAAIGASGVATVPGIMKRLEAKGYITRTVYQKGRRVCIAATGKCTATPRNTAPHWRMRTEALPTPAIQALRERSKPIAAMIEAEARMSGKSHSEFLADLVYIGWHEYQAEKEIENAQSI
jgi:DNA-binding Lrp family transcriptional regulator